MSNTGGGRPELDLRLFLKELSSRKRLVSPSSMLKLEFQVARFIQEAQPSPILVNSEKGPIVSNLLASREALYLALNVSSDAEAYLQMSRALASPRKIELLETPSMASLGDDLYKLPIPKFFELDGGHYITAGIFVAKECDGNAINASIHRAMLLDENHLAVRLVPRHLYHMFTKAEKKRCPLRAAILIGAPPIFYLTAASSPPYGVYEAEVANSLAGGSLAATVDLLEGVPLPVPSEYVILGEFLLDRRAKEGPFVDILGTYDEVREEPVFKVHEILARPSPLFYSILPSGEEHILLMGFPREVTIWESVSKVVPRVHRVRLPVSGGGWLYAVVSIDKNVDGDAKNAILAAFAAHPSLKLVVVVDGDVNPDNPREVEWAIATRMQPDEDVIILRGVRGSSLDPSADQKSLTTSKMGIDATRPLGKPDWMFKRARIPE
ncbi:MAG: UbiD family decarboxylase [Infirmifilum sp.]|uniref:UbiD family decarboxylase n=1 Tax=Infirmifilum TaxID=2856573 RepID=UPI003C747A93